MRDTAVVVPCYNETSRLDAAAFREYARHDPHVSFLFVNDGSTDRTQDILDELNRTDPVGCRVLRLERNGGKAEAVRQGVLAALETGPDYVGYWDADLATPLEVIPEFRALLAARPALELVLGSRVRLLGRDVRRSPRRHYLGRVFATVASHVLGLSVYDTQCGAKLFRVSPTTRQLFQEPFRSTWIFDVEILARLIRARHRSSQYATERVLCEFPLPSWVDVAGSKLKARDFLRAPLELGGIYRHYLAGLRWDAGRAGGTPGPHRARDRARGRNSPRPPGGTADWTGS
jgi:glycosyltransferase involved in cell wall biosynthesis